MNKLTQKQRNALQVKRYRIGNQLKEWRESQGCTQARAARYFDVSVHTYAKWERGDSMAPDDVMAKI